MAIEGMAADVLGGAGGIGIGIGIGGMGGGAMGSSGSSSLAGVTIGGASDGGRTAVEASASSWTGEDLYGMPRSAANMKPAS